MTPYEQLALLFEQQQQQGRRDMFRATRSLPDRVWTVEQQLAYLIWEHQGGGRAEFPATGSLLKEASGRGVFPVMGSLPEEASTTIEQQLLDILIREQREHLLAEQYRSLLSLEHSQLMAQLQRETPLQRVWTVEQQLTYLIWEHQGGGRGAFPATGSFLEEASTTIEQQLLDILIREQREHLLAEQYRSLLSLDHPQLMAQLQHETSLQQAQTGGSTLLGLDQGRAVHPLSLGSTPEARIPILPTYGNLDGFPENQYRVLLEAERQGRDHVTFPTYEVQAQQAIAAYSPRNTPSRDGSYRLAELERCMSLEHHQLLAQQQQHLRDTFLPAQADLQAGGYSYHDLPTHTQSSKARRKEIHEISKEGETPSEGSNEGTNTGSDGLLPKDNIAKKQEDLSSGKKRSREEKTDDQPIGVQIKDQLQLDSADAAPGQKCEELGVSPQKKQDGRLADENADVLRRIQKEGLIDTPKTSAEANTGTETADITDLTNHMPELTFSVSNTFEGALNSSDTHLGAELLTFAATFSQRVPNERLCKVLLELLMFGPNSGGTHFPDCQRMELATNYMSLLLSKPGFADKLSRVVKPSFWEECLDQMTSPIYTVDGDEHRISAAAIGRIGQSLHVKACCAELFLELLSRELKGFVRKLHDPDPNTDTDTDTDTGSLYSKPIVKHILDHPRRAKEALEKAFKACTQIWSMYGHFILCDLPDLEAAMEADDGPSVVSVHFVRSQASRLVQVMGKLCSYLAWLYGFDAHENAISLAYLVNGNLPQELEETTFDPAPFSDAADYSKEVRLSFLLNLDERCAPELTPVLAEMLGVVTKYNAICG
jgi:hypothetical protein